MLKVPENFSTTFENTKGEGVSNLMLLYKSVYPPFGRFIKTVVQPVPKSTASTELTEPIKGVGDLPIPILNKWS